MYNTDFSQNDYIESLFFNGNVCLSAAKTNNIDVKFRPFIALFSDRTFLVDERAEFDKVIKNIIIRFRITYPTPYTLEWKYVPNTLLKAVYLKAQEFNWYSSQYPMPNNLSTEELKKLNYFMQCIMDLKCLSITNLVATKWYQHFSPDVLKFALFDNGYLVISEDCPILDELPSRICETYPEINIIDIVPQYFISAIYERLLYTQLSARERYIELKKLDIMQKNNYSDADALKALQNKTKLWEDLLLTDEQTARSMIYSHYVKKHFEENPNIM